MSTYTGVTNFQKTVQFFGPPCIYRKYVNGLLMLFFKEDSDLNAKKDS